jgi:hypothetical protein
LGLLHIDLFGEVKTTSISGNKYRLVITNDYNMCAWVKFLKIKNEAYDVFNTFCQQVQAEEELKMLKMRNDYGGGFQNDPIELFCQKHGILHEFSSPRTPNKMGL